LQGEIEAKKEKKGETTYEALLRNLEPGKKFHVRITASNEYKSSHPTTAIMVDVPDGIIL
jgi:hypothetical protein